MKKIILLLTFVILLSSFAYADVWSNRDSDRTQYYQVNGKYNLTDDIGDGIGLNGNIIAAGETSTTSGWNVVTNVCTYYNSYGNLGNSTYSMYCYNGGFDSNTIFTINNTALGMIGATIKFNGNMPPNSSGIDGFYFASFMQSGGHVFLRTMTDGSNKWAYADGVACDANTLYFSADTEYALLLNWTSASTIDGYIAANGTDPSDFNLCHTFTGRGGVNYIRWFAAAADPSFNITDIFITKTGVRPTVEAAPPPPTPTSTPAFDWPTPPDNRHNNTQQTINCTHNSSDVRFNLWINDTAIYNNITANFTNHIIYNTGFVEGNNNYTCNVQNASSGIFSNNITRHFTLDNATPVITVHANNGFLINNLTRTDNYFNTSLLINMSFTDANLYRFLINITNSTGDTVFYNLTDITGYTYYNFTKSINISGYSIGTYYPHIYASDTHTAKEWDCDYTIGLTSIEFDTPEKNKIKIKSLSIPISKDVQDKKDRKSYEFTYLFESDEREFILTSESPITYLESSKVTNSPHFGITRPGEITGNWVDFDELELKKEDFIVTKISDYEYRINIIKPGKKSFKFESIGGLNVANIEARFELTGVLNITAYDPVLNVAVNFTTTLNSISKVQSGNSTQYTNLTAGTYTLNLTASGYETLSYDVTIDTPYKSLQYYFYESNVVDDCTLYNQTILTMAGKDEETNADVNMTLDITYTHFSTRNQSNIKNTSLELRNKYNYSLCTNMNQTFKVDALMVYGDDSIYSKRMYYLVNYTANSSVSNIIYLYHINQSLRTEVIFTVYNEVTGARVPNAYIKAQRYYPGEGVYRTVEITKTDETGQTVGKMRLADIFYKFIIEEPAGTVREVTDVLRLLSAAKSFGINYGTGYLDTFNKINGVTGYTSCTKGTKTCRVVWADESNIVRDVTLEVYRKNGFRSTLIYTNTVAATSGTIAYTIVEDTAGNSYEAMSYIESNTGTSNYFFGSGGLDFLYNPFFDSTEHRLASLFPLFLLGVVVVFALVDFGAIGVTIGGLLVLIIGMAIKVLPLSRIYFLSCIAMAVILVYKLSK